MRWNEKVCIWKSWLTNVTPSDLNTPRHFSDSAPSMGGTERLITLSILARATLQTLGVACSLKPARVCSEGGWVWRLPVR